MVKHQFTKERRKTWLLWWWPTSSCVNVITRSSLWVLPGSKTDNINLIITAARSEAFKVFWIYAWIIILKNTVFVMYLRVIHVYCMPRTVIDEVRVDCRNLFCFIREIVKNKSLVSRWNFLHEFASFVTNVYTGIYSGVTMSKWAH